MNIFSVLKALSQNWIINDHHYLCWTAFICKLPVEVVVGKEVGNDVVAPDTGSLSVEPPIDGVVVVAD